MNTNHFKIIFQGFNKKIKLLFSRLIEEKGMLN